MSNISHNNYVELSIFQGQRSQGLTGLAMAPCEHHCGAAYIGEPISNRVAEAKKVATINQLKYCCRSCEI